MNINQLFEEWKRVRNEGLSYSRAGLDEMTDDQYEKGERLYDRRKEIEATLLEMGYDIVDGDRPYSFELKKIS